VCGIDLGKTVFHLVGLSKEGHIVVKKRFSRKQLLTCTANMPVCLIGMEACAGAHFLARALVAQGHTVKLIPAEYVRPFVKSNKNDYVDAEAIAEAVQRPTMRFVPIKNEGQLTLYAANDIERHADLARII
jgi:transposase